MVGFMIGLLALISFLVPIVLLIVYIIKTNTLERKMRYLEQTIVNLQFSVKQPQATVEAVPEKREPQVKERPEPALVERSSAIPPLPPPMKLKQPSRTQEEWESLVGGKLLNRIGALALILGVGFFLKYAFDHDWITETARVLIGIAIGGLCLLGGARTQKKDYQVFAQGLVGAGVSILYLSVYASFNFYHLVPQWVAFLLMSGVTIITLAQALYYNSITVSVLGWAGGFLTPLMLSTGQSNEAALFTYVALLVLGLLAIVVKKESWIVVEPLTLGAMYVMYFSWYNKYYTPQDFTLTVFFICTFWMLFYGLDLIRLKLHVKSYLKIRHVVQSFNALFFFIALYDLVDSPYHSIMGAVAVLLGAVYIATFFTVRKLYETDADTEARYALTGIALIVIATAIEYEGLANVRFWSLEAFILLWLGFWHQRRYIWISSLVLYGASVMALLFTRGALQYAPLEFFTLLFNNRAFTFLLVAATFGMGTLLMQKVKDSKAFLVQEWLGFGFFMILFLLLTVETNDYFENILRHGIGIVTRGPNEITALQNQRQIVISGVWLLYSIVIMVVGIARNLRGPRFIAIGLFGLSILKIFIVDLSFLETLYRIFSFIGLGVILLAVSFMYQRYKSLIFGQSAANQERESQ
ncbi:MAG: DUF2339 domain-containing protein [Ignavibacteriales bacterium]|nr:DUF2339 domain-containing protein [Ignavibacteriales bacterium]